MGEVTIQAGFDYLQKNQINISDEVGWIKKEVVALKKTVEILDKIRTGKPIYINVAPKTVEGLN